MEDERDAVQTTMAAPCWSNWKITSAAQQAAGADRANTPQVKGSFPFVAFL
jgi:hypothetical protein